MKLKSRELKDFFVACLLGDGNLHNGSFSVKHINKDLVYFKKKVISKHLNTNVKVTEHKSYVGKDGTSHKKYWSLYASPCEYFKKLQNEFYPNGVKILPNKYIRNISDLGKAILYADDGTTVLVGFNDYSGSARSRRIQICTDHFNKKDVHSIKEIFERDYGKNSLKIITREPEKSWRTVFYMKPGQKFIIDISKYFIKYFPSLLYKMDLGYRNESLKNRKYVSKNYENLYSKIKAHPLFKDRLKNRG